MVFPATHMPYLICPTEESDWATAGSCNVRLSSELGLNHRTWSTARYLIDKLVPYLCTLFSVDSNGRNAPSNAFHLHDRTPLKAQGEDQIQKWIHMRSNCGRYEGHMRALVKVLRWLLFFTHTQVAKLKCKANDRRQALERKRRDHAFER